MLVDVGGIPTPLNNISSSVGVTILNWMTKKIMFQTTNQIHFIKLEVRQLIS